MREKPVIYQQPLVSKQLRDHLIHKCDQTIKWVNKGKYFICVSALIHFIWHKIRQREYDLKSEGKHENKITIDNLITGDSEWICSCSYKPTAHWSLGLFWYLIHAFILICILMGSIHLYMGNFRLRFKHSCSGFSRFIHILLVGYNLMDLFTLIRKDMAWLRFHGFTRIYVDRSGGWHDEK